MKPKNLQRQKERSLIVKRLQDEKRLDERIEFLVASLTLEELVQLKIEVTARALETRRFIGFKIYEKMPSICLEGMVNFIIKNVFSMKEFSSCLGVSVEQAEIIVKKFELSTEHFDKCPKEIAKIRKKDKVFKATIESVVEDKEFCETPKVEKVKSRRKKRQIDPKRFKVIPDFLS